MKKEAKIKVVIVEPNKAARIEIINNELEIFQSLVGGYIEHIREEGYDIIINEEGKLIDLEPNFLIYGGNDYVAGTAIFVGVNYYDGEMKSLTPEQVFAIASQFDKRSVTHGI